MIYVLFLYMLYMFSRCVFFILLCMYSKIIHSAYMPKSFCCGSFKVGDFGSLSAISGDLVHLIEIPTKEEEERGKTCF